MKYRNLTASGICMAILCMTTGAASGAITDDLVRHYKLDESAGAVAAVDSIGVKDLTQDGGLGGPLPVPGATGQIGNAWDFEADNGEFLDEGDAVWGGNDAVSASMWINLESLDPGTNYTIFSEDSGTLVSGSKDSIFQIIDGGKLEWTLEMGGVTQEFITTDTAVVAAGSWHHVAVVLENDIAMIYLNGGEVKSQGVPDELVDSVNDLMLGAYEDSDASDPFDGLIDDAGFWNRALLPSEVNSIYQEGLLGNDLTNAVPEPAGAALLLGGAGLAMCRRRLV
jgi:concanavalin A-like lectin/glucanase superfamily protein